MDKSTGIKGVMFHTIMAAKIDIQKFVKFILKLAMLVLYVHHRKEKYFENCTYFKMKKASTIVKVFILVFTILLTFAKESEGTPMLFELLFGRNNIRYGQNNWNRRSSVPQNNGGGHRYRDICKVHSRVSHAGLVCPP